MVAALYVINKGNKHLRESQFSESQLYFNYLHFLD